MENKTQKINQPKKCQEKRYDNSPCNRPLYDEQYCIFHSENIEQKKDDFDKAFWKDFERQKKEEQCYDFSSFIFPDSISFEEIEFDKDVYFNRAQFTGEVTSFHGAKFTGEETYFDLAKFTGKVIYFSGAKFSCKKTYFLFTKFIAEYTYFEGAKFTGNETDFSWAKFTGEVTDFMLAQFTGNETNFSEAEFTGNVTYFNGATFTCEVKLSHAVFKNVLYLFESLVKEKKWLFFKIKRYLIKDWRFYLQPETANRHPLVKRLVNDAWYLEEFKFRHPIAYFFWKILANCGRSILLWAAWSLGIAFGFGLIFMRMCPQSFELRHANTGFSFFYYSFVTFTTLGFGDITPKTLSAEILVTIEVILGYIMLGGLISILANKLARRS